MKCFDCLYCCFNLVIWCYHPPYMQSRCIYDETAPNAIIWATIWYGHISLMIGMGWQILPSTKLMFNAKCFSTMWQTKVVKLFYTVSNNICMLGCSEILQYIQSIYSAKRTFWIQNVHHLYRSLAIITHALPFINSGTILGIHATLWSNVTSR